MNHMTEDEWMTARGCPPRKLLRYDECKCILSQYCDGTCNPVYEDRPAPVQASEQYPQGTDPEESEKMYDATNASRILGALERMDALLSADRRLLAVGPDSATAKGARADMALIRAALCATPAPPPAATPPNIRVNHQGVAVDYSYPWLPMSSCPINADVWLLGANGIGVPGRWNGKDPWYRRWAPKPKLVDGPL